MKYGIWFPIWKFRCNFHVIGFAKKIRLSSKNISVAIPIVQKWFVDAQELIPFDRLFWPKLSEQVLRFVLFCVVLLCSSYGGFVSLSINAFSGIISNNVNNLPFLMMTSSNGNIFRVSGPLCGKLTGLRYIPRTKPSDAELWCFLWSAPN